LFKTRATNALIVDKGNKKLSYRKEIVRLLFYNIEIMVSHKSHIVLVLIGLLIRN